jgi:hypothetical protein
MFRAWNLAENPTSQRCRALLWGFDGLTVNLPAQPTVVQIRPGPTLHITAVGRPVPGLPLRVPGWLLQFAVAQVVAIPVAIALLQSTL